jgi:hypothetical protein
MATMKQLRAKLVVLVNREIALKATLHTIRRQVTEVKAALTDARRAEKEATMATVQEDT